MTQLITPWHPVATTNQPWTTSTSWTRGSFCFALQWNALQWIIVMLPSPALPITTFLVKRAATACLFTFRGWLVGYMFMSAKSDYFAIWFWKFVANQRIATVPISITPRYSVCTSGMAHPCKGSIFRHDRALRAMTTLCSFLRVTGAAIDNTFRVYDILC